MSLTLTLTPNLSLPMVGVRLTLTLTLTPNLTLTHHQVEAASDQPPLPGGKPPSLDFAQFDALLDRHSAYAKQAPNPNPNPNPNPDPNPNPSPSPSPKPPPQAQP